MLFDRLADSIIKNAKLIVVLWIVVLLVSAPLALKSGEVMNYNMSEMGNDDSESMEGVLLIKEYFPTTSTDVSSAPILVLHYTTAEQKAVAEGFAQWLNQHGKEYKDADGESLLGTKDAPDLTFMNMGCQGKDSDNEGILMVGVIYNQDLIKHKYSTNIVAYVQDDTPHMREFIAQQKADYAEDVDSAVNGIGSYLTGSQAIGYDTMDGAMKDISRIDPFTVLLILVLVGLFFRSFVTSGAPPVTIGAAFVVVLALIFGIGQFLEVFFITELMLLVAMMGAGCDYCIFIIARYREELRAGKCHHDALHEAIKWAGESISISGLAVMIGFGAMCICSITFVSTMGICLALGIMVALLAALTLIPAILELVGDRIFWPTRIDAYQEGGKATRGWFAWCGRFGKRYFEASAKFAIKHAKAIVIAAVLITIPCVYVMSQAETSYDMIGAMQTGDSGVGMDLMDEYAYQGLMMPNYILLQSSGVIATVQMETIMPGFEMMTLTWTEEMAKMDLDPLFAEIQKDSNIADIVGPFQWDAVVKKTAESMGLDPENKSVLVSNATAIIDKIIADSSPLIKPYVEAVLEQMRANLGALSDPIMMSLGGVVDYIVNVQAGIVGGDIEEGSLVKDVYFTKVIYSTVDAAMSPVSMKSIDNVKTIVADYMTTHSDVVKQEWCTGTPTIMYDISVSVSNEFTNIEIIVVILIMILLFLVMKSYTIPVRSVLTILMSIAWTLAATHLLFGNIMGAEVMWLIPLILLVICLGLGMDYDILLTTRIKENVIKGMSNDDAIYHAVTHSGSVITVCGLIMGGAFGTLMLSTMLMMQEFGFALCFAILVDALIVRTYIVPAVMHLLGDLNWKGPKFMGSKIGKTE